jgi:hypothetical protein
MADTPDDPVERLVALGQAAMRRLRAKNLWLWLLIVVMLAVAGWYFQDVVVGAVKSGRDVFLAWLKPIAARPMGVGGLSLLVFIAAVVIIVPGLALAETSQLGKKLERWMDGKARGTELEQAIQRAENAEKRLAEAKQKALEEHFALKSDRDQWRDTSNGHFWQHHFRMERPYVPELIGESQRTWYETLVKPEIEKLRAVSKNANEKLIGSQGLSGVMRVLRDGYQARLPKWVADAIDEEAYLPCARTFSLFKEPSQQDVRVRFLAFYERYNRLRAVLFDLATLAGINLAVQPEYAEWRVADQEFFRRLHEALDVHVLQDFKSRIEDVNERGRREFDSRYPVLLPEPERLGGTRQEERLLPPYLSPSPPPLPQSVPRIEEPS